MTEEELSHIVRSLNTETIDYLCELLPFPDVEQANEEGLIAIGGDLSVYRLISAYAQGIFPWYSTPPILWHTPDPRMLLLLEDFHIARSLRRTIKKQIFSVTFDKAFGQVLSNCSELRQDEGTWLNKEMIEAYLKMHEIGLAHSVEAWYGDELAGGLYGIAMGRAFFGESMFFKKPDASKVALAALVERLKQHGYMFIDCQVYTDNLFRFGAEMFDREDFLEILHESLQFATEQGSWQN